MPKRVQNQQAGILLGATLLASMVRQLSGLNASELFMLLLYGFTHHSSTIVVSF